jgi:HPt (histidine-containing phosphotransfer) domain-containing protein
MATDGDILASLRPSYLARLEARVSHLRTFAQALGNGALQPVQQGELHRTAHSMASSAAIFGHSGLSAAARATEQVFEQSEIGVAEQRVSLHRLLSEAERVLASHS